MDVSRVFSNASVHLIRPKFIKVGGLSRLSAFFTHYFAIRGVIKKKKIDAIMLYSVPTNGFQAVYLAHKFGIPIIFRSLDILHQLVVQPPLRPITKIMEKWVYSNVDMGLTITPKLSEYMIKMGAEADKVKVLPLPVDTNRFCPSSDTEVMRQKWGIRKDDQVILYMGTLYWFSGLRRFIRQMPYIIEHAPKAKLMIVGDGKQRPELDMIITELGLRDKVIITGFQPYKEMPAYINLADVCVNPFRFTDATRDIFPGKTVQFLACGKPLVATSLPGMKAVISGEGQGIVYVSNVAEMAGAVIGLLRLPESRKEIGQSGLEYVRQVHSCEVVTGKLVTILESLK
jgi:glycosyltransferase involved in cell wall biosynthesis